MLRRTKYAEKLFFFKMLYGVTVTFTMVMVIFSCDHFNFHQVATMARFKWRHSIQNKNTFSVYLILEIFQRLHGKITVFSV